MMDELTHRTGITATGRHLNSPFEPTQEVRHTNRHLRACATMAPPPGEATVLEQVHPDGRVAFPDIVQYQLKRWDETAKAYVLAELVDLPPTFETHPDEHAHDLARKAGQQPRPATLPYVAEVHDLDAYDSLKATGILHAAHMTAPEDERTAVDNRAAPGA
ncbi:hypothetical protein TSH58p_17385 [Azospirillum sp. TSH58]|uniref:hypothetical protein n=1 Tax=Azospirillum sp. TSH58 TaxID=664962 RepID=UPI000D5FE8EE|nr:hypothetical protein [Azospirillum sp. TSH58]AWJ85138.1 hypothetical protein TSH58p_17385 [Azospirillum sp. TSH58]PWC80814.1 hypothetical protein TSH58_00790 [Azospirillum sp. TSH58]